MRGQAKPQLALEQGLAWAAGRVDVWLIPIINETTVSCYPVEPEALVFRPAHAVKAPPASPALPHPEKSLPVLATGSRDRAVGMAGRPAKPVHVVEASQWLTRLRTEDRENQGGRFAGSSLGDVVQVRGPDIALGEIRRQGAVGRDDLAWHRPLRVWPCTQRLAGCPKTHRQSRYEHRRPANGRRPASAAARLVRPTAHPYCPFLPADLPDGKLNHIPRYLSVRTGGFWTVIVFPVLGLATMRLETGTRLTARR
jgi:hypothetical protein